MKKAPAHRLPHRHAGHLRLAGMAHRRSCGSGVTGMSSTGGERGKSLPTEHRAMKQAGFEA